MNTGKVCGTGAQCEVTCPVMRLGRDCPTLPAFLEEVAALIAECGGSPELVAQPA